MLTPEDFALQPMDLSAEDAAVANLAYHESIERHKRETIRRALTDMLEERFKIHHATIQTETEPCGDEESLHK